MFVPYQLEGGKYIKQSFPHVVHIVYVIESAAYGVLFTSCLCQNPNERGTSE